MDLHWQKKNEAIMKDSLFEAMINVQKEYLALLKNYKKIYNDQHLLQIVDEIRIFWKKKQPIVDAFLKYKIQPYETYLFTSVMMVDYESKEHLPFLCLGKFHIVDDPICKYLLTISSFAQKTFTERLREEIKNTIDDNIKIIENCLQVIWVLPIRYLYSDSEIMNSKATECFLDLFDGAITSVDDFFKLDSIYQIDSMLPEKSKKALVFLETEDPKLSLPERFIRYKNELATDFLGSDNDAVVFFSAIYGNFAQAIDVVFVCELFHLIPYLRYQVAFQYFIYIANSMVSWFDDMNIIMMNALLANIVYNKFNIDKLENYSF